MSFAAKEKLLCFIAESNANSALIGMVVLMMKKFYCKECFKSIVTGNASNENGSHVYHRQSTQCK